MSDITLSQRHQLSLLTLIQKKNKRKSLSVWNEILSCTQSENFGSIYTAQCTAILVDNACTKQCIWYEFKRFSNIHYGVCQMRWHKTITQTTLNSERSSPLKQLFHTICSDIEFFYKFLLAVLHWANKFLLDVLYSSLVIYWIVFLRCKTWFWLRKWQTKKTHPEICRSKLTFLT